MARKLKALAERGDAGEKESARTKYFEYLKKHDLSDSDISPDMHKRIIEAKDDYKDVLLNVILSVNPYTRHSDGQTYIECFLDDEDFAEVLKKFDYFKKLLTVEKELLITAFLSKHADAFEPDSHALKKWRERRVENSALTTKKHEAEIIKQEYNRLQSEVAMNIDVTQKVVQSGDRLKIAAFNKDRSEQMIDILLESEYVRHRTRIGK